MKRSARQSTPLSRTTSIAPSMRCRFHVTHRSLAPRGFTLIEILVTAALLIITMAAMIQIFNVTSDTTTRTTANSAVMARSAAVREALSDQVSKMSPGLLIIESPMPTSVRAETEDGFRMWRLRHDRLVFLTTGDVDEYQSFTDPTRADPNGAVAMDQKPRTATSSEALVYFGPGTPLTISTGPVRPARIDDDTDPAGAVLTASEWVFLHRAILLNLDIDPNADPAWNPTTMSQVTAAGGMLNGGPLRPEFQNGSMDVIVSDTVGGYPATARAFASLILSKIPGPADLLGETPSIASLWQPSYAPRNANMQNVNLLNYYTRSGSNFVPGLADFRIEWTDGGSIDPLGPDGIPFTGDEDLRTRWFGLRPDPTFDIDDTTLNGIISGTGPELPYVAVRRQDFTTDTRNDAATAFGIAPGTQNRIEWSRNGNGSGTDSAYRAIWRLDTWQHRPKALRFTYRIFDDGNRLKQTTEIDLNENGDFDPDDGPNDQQRRLIMRWGRSFSVVVPVP